MATFLGIDYPTWWFMIIGAVFTGYAILDGFDLGVGILHLFHKDEIHRRISLNSIGPVWDGNEVWIVIGGGALFAGFPLAYATYFSTFYIPFMLFLVVLIFRAIAIEFRGKEPMQWWKKSWDIAFSVSSALIALLLGIVLGNVLAGLPFDQSLQFHGNLLTFFHPFSILTGLTTASLFTMHGSIYLVMKTVGNQFAFTRKLVNWSVAIFVFFYIITTIYVLAEMPALSDKIRSGGFLALLPFIALISVSGIIWFTKRRQYWYGFLSSAVTISILLIIVAVEIFPNIILSSIAGDANVTVYRAAATDRSLGIMLIITAIGAPLAAFYSLVVFWTFRGKVKLDKDSY